MFIMNGVGGAASSHANITFSAPRDSFNSFHAHSDIVPMVSKVVDAKALRWFCAFAEVNAYEIKISFGSYGYTNDNNSNNNSNNNNL